MFSLFIKIEVRGEFLNISKAFDKIWDDGLIFQLSQHGIPGNFLRLIKNFPKNCKQRVVLNGQASSWANLHTGVPEGSVLGLIFFLICINNLTDNLSSNPKLFTDDESLFPETKISQPKNDLRKCVFGLINGI